MGLREEIEAEDVRYRASLIECCARTGAADPSVLESLAQESKTRQRAIFARFWPATEAISPPMDGSPSHS